MTGQADICTGAINILLRRRYDYGIYMRLTLQRYITRQPRPINAYGNISKPFPSSVWTISVIFILVLAILLYVSHKIYQSDDLKRHQLAKEEMLAFNFFLFAFAKLTEPDPLPWFHKWSTGRFVVFLWSLLSLFLLMFYTSNLRAYMVMVEYEKAPVDLYDVYNRGQRVYIYDVAPRQRLDTNG